MIIQRLVEYSQRFDVGIPELSKLNASDSRGVCLITGEQGPTLLVHPTRKKDSTWGLSGKGAIGGKLSSVNFAAAEWHGAAQGDVAPFGLDAAARLAIAQANVFAGGGKSRIVLGDVTISLWLHKPNEQVEQHLLWTWLGCGKQDNGTDSRKAFMQSLGNPESIYPGCMHEMLCLFLSRQRQGRQVVLAFAEMTLLDLLKRIWMWGGARQCLFDLPAMIAFIDGEPPKMEAKGLRVLDPSRSDPGYLTGRRLAVIAKAARLLRLPSCVDRILVKRVQDCDVVMANNEFARNIARLKRTSRFSSIATVIATLPPATVKTSLTNEFQSSLHAGYDHQLLYMGELSKARPHITKNQTWVRSRGERLIGDALTAMGLAWIYEQPTVIGGDCARYRIPDFTLSCGTIIEYLGGAHDVNDSQWDAKLSAMLGAGKRVIVIDERAGKPRSYHEMFDYVKESLDA